MRNPVILLLRGGSFTLFLLFALNAFGQNDSVNNAGNSKQPVYTTVRLSGPKPVIDGKLDDECWKRGTWAGDWTQLLPSEGSKPTWPTVMNIQYDDQNLYVAFRAFDGEPGKIHRYPGARDEFSGDMLGVNFDSYRDYRTGFEFTVTSWGQKIDLILFNPNNWDVNWAAVWKVKTGTEDSAWIAEMEIPFSQLRYSNKKEQVWGMHTWRWIDRLQEESNWEKQTMTGPGMMYNFGELRGISDLPRSRRIELMPYALGSMGSKVTDDGNPFAGKYKAGGNAGIDAKIGLSSNFTLDLTINPDFGQVESDPSVMNLTAFETFYEEKRPFFLEGLTIFDFDFDDKNLFYSRRIGHSPSRRIESIPGAWAENPDMTSILSAVKVSGTTSKGLSLGFIQSFTAPEYAAIQDNSGNISHRITEPFTAYNVARIQKGYKSGTTVLGAMLTSVNRWIDNDEIRFLPKGAYTGGIDIIHRWKDKEFFIDARLMGSYVEGSSESMVTLQESSARYFNRPGASYLRFDTARSSLAGAGGRVKIGKGAKGFWRYSTELMWLTPGLELNDIGYLTSVDVVSQKNEVSYFVNKPVSIFRTYTVSLEQFNQWNFGGKYLGSGGHLSARAEFLNMMKLSTNVVYHSSAPDMRHLRGGEDFTMPSRTLFFGNGGTDNSKRVSFSVDYMIERQGNNSGTMFQIVPAISVRPIRNLKIGISADFSENHNELQYTGSAEYSPARRTILADIDQRTMGFTARIDLHITPEFSIRYYGNPFVSSGVYSDFKKVTDADAGKYESRFERITSFSKDAGYILIDENNDMATDYMLPDPDFNFIQYRSNLVARWEYRPGSFIYLVWASDRTSLTNDGGVSISDSFGKMGNIKPGNMFIVKLNYWFSL